VWLADDGDSSGRDGDGAADGRAGEEFDAVGGRLGPLSGVVDEEQVVGFAAAAPDDFDPRGRLVLRSHTGFPADAVEQVGERVRVGVGGQVPGGSAAVVVASDGRVTGRRPVGEGGDGQRALEPDPFPGLTLTIYTAEPGSPSEEGLNLLASWAASQEAATDSSLRPPTSAPN
jgi:hypothetical protein